jgi:kumamolisin
MSSRTPSLLAATAVVAALALAGPGLPAQAATVAASAPVPAAAAPGGVPASSDPTVGATPGDTAVDLTLVLRAVDPAALAALPTATAGDTVDERAAAVASVAPAEDARTRARTVLTTAGFTVTDPDTWEVEARGTAAQAEALFGVHLVGTGDGMHPTAEPTVPQAFGGSVVTVLGLDTRPALAHAAVPGGYAPADLARAYRSSGSATAGAGATIATVQFSGWDRNDLSAYAAATGRPLPALDQIAVDGADPHVADGNRGETEVALDQEALLAVAPGARQRVYVTPNSFQGSYDAYSRIADDVRTAGITAVSISWGSCETLTSAGARNALDAALARIVAAGATVFAATGDDGARCPTGPETSIVDVSYPASSPVVVGVGGTSLTKTSSGWTESGWSNDLGAGGGGTSTAYARPAWQQGAGISGTKRVLPDVAALADPAKGPAIYMSTLHGFVLGGGTSLASPVVAGQLAVALTARGCAAGVGDVHRALYANPTAFRDVVTGGNGTASATRGWDAATGLGTPDWSALGRALPTAADCTPSTTSAAAAGADATSVTSGTTTVPAGTSIHSPSGQYWLDMQTDGSLVEWGNGRRLWQSSGQADGAGLRLDPTGRLSVVAPSGAVLWSTTAQTTSGGARLTVDDTGDVRVTARDGAVLWRNAAPGADQLVPGATLVAGQSVRDTTGTRRLSVRASGVLAVTAGGRVTFMKAGGGAGASLQLLPSGDLVLSGPLGAKRWSSGTAGSGGTGMLLRMQADGNVVLRTGSTTVWATNTRG